MINNRQNGRRRGRGGGGQRQGGGGGGGQRDSGNRIDSRARGNANQLFEKYKNMARDAQMSGDRVTTEYYLQFADHYFRVLMDQRGRQEDNQQRRPRDDFDPYDDGDDFGADFTGEGEPIRADEQPRASEGDGRRDGGQREAGQRDRGPREGEQRDAGQRDGDKRERAPREPRGGRGGDERRFQRAAAPANDLDETPTQDASPAPAADGTGDEAEPRRRGRPRRVRADVAEAPATDGGALDADRLPPSLSTAAPAEEEEAPKPRRRRARATAAAEAPQDD